jgi:cellulose biosynthesis protein BcsQ
MGGKVITFYSYKGGTGRSMLLANVAWLLACNGQRVLVIDWDLEAPGLHRYFKPFLVDPDLFETDGLIDVFWAAATRALADQGSDGKASLRERSLASEDIDLEDYINPLKWQFHGGSIDFIGAGRQGATYSERVNTFDWKRFYQMGGGALLDRIKSDLTADYPFILIDSRTGVSDTSGICTMQLPDVLVACLTLNRQSIDGVASILDSARSWRKSQAQAAELAMFPVVTRVENSEKLKLDAARSTARRVLQTFLPRSDAETQREYWDDMEVTYRPFYAYEEVLAAFGDPAGAGGSAKTLLSEMEAVGRRVSGRRDLTMPEIPEEDRKRVLKEYALGSPAEPAPSAEPVRPADPADPSDTEFLRGVYAKEGIWRRSGWNYRNLLSTRELHLIKPQEVSEFGRNMAFFFKNSQDYISFRLYTNTTFYWSIISLVVSSIIYILVLKYINYSLPIGNSPSTLSEAKMMAAAQEMRTTAMLVILIWPPILFVSRIFLAAQHRPHGVTLTDILLFSFLGPFSPGIRDFQQGETSQEPARVRAGDSGSRR